MNFIMGVLPSTRFFWLKRHILTFFDVQTGSGSRVAGGLKVYGRSKVVIGDNVWVGINLRIYLSPDAGVRIGNNCDIAPEVVIHSGSHLHGNLTRRAGMGFGKEITIGDGVWIGARATILAGCDIGAGSIVAAGTLLLDRKYPANSLLAGVPAEVVKELA